MSFLGKLYKDLKQNWFFFRAFLEYMGKKVVDPKLFRSLLIPPKSTDLQIISLNPLHFKGWPTSTKLIWKSHVTLVKTLTNQNI